MKCNIDNVQHLIGNPVFAIETNLSVLERKTHDYETKEILTAIQTSLERIKKVLGELED